MVTTENDDKKYPIQRKEKIKCFLGNDGDDQR